MKLNKGKINDIGIYIVKNLENKKVYIGQSIHIKKRIREHKILLRNNKHYNKHLQNAWNKYGEDNFEFRVVEYCSLDVLDEKEKEWIKLWISTNDDYGYNLESGGNKNKIVNEKTKLKISKANKGRVITAEQKNNLKKSAKRGEKSILSKLTNDNIIDIKERLIKGEKIKEISSFYDVSDSVISDIKLGKTWKHIITEYDEQLSKNSKCNITENMAKKIKLLIYEEFSPKEISEKLNIDVSYIYSIKSLISWKDVCPDLNEKIKSIDYKSGENNPSAKLTVNEVIRIKQLLKENKTSQAKIGEMFNVSQYIISSIKLGKIWKSVLI